MGYNGQVKAMEGGKMDKLMTIKDIEGLAQVTRKTVLRWMKSGELRAFKVGGTSWRIREQDLRKFIKGGER
jgi:excisionase family DNA binding protein